MKNICTLIALSIPFVIFAQTPTPPDIDALEGIIVEKYYVSGEGDFQNGALPIGSTTYRVFIDMKPGYELQMVIGSFPPFHPLSIETTGSFYNNPLGVTFGSNFLPFLLNFDTAVLDSYISLGASAQGYWAVPKDADPDGSILTGGADGQYLLNNDPSAGVSPLVKDGFIEGSTTAVGVLGIDDLLNTTVGLNTASGQLNTSNGVWFDLEGVLGPTEENTLLIGQFTTTECDFSFKINLQIIIPEELRTDQRLVIQFVAESAEGDQAINDSGDNYIIYQKDILTYEAECLPISTTNNASDNQNWGVLPNPSSGTFSVIANEALSGVLYTVYDLQGRLLLSKSGGNLEPNAITEIDLNAFPEGVYLLNLQTASGERSTKRIVKTQ